MQADTVRAPWYSRGSNARSQREKWCPCKCTDQNIEQSFHLLSGAVCESRPRSFDLAQKQCSSALELNAT